VAGHAAHNITNDYQEQRLNQEPRTKNQEPRTKNQEPRIKNQTPNELGLAAFGFEVWIELSDTIRAYAMGKLRIGVSGDVLLQLLIITAVVTNFFAIRTKGYHSG